MSEEKGNDLSPWVHPKSQAWFQALFRRTNLLMSLENEMKRPNEQLDIHIVRMALAMAVMFGRPEIWPSGDREVMELVVAKAREFVKLPPQAKSGKAVTVAEHQAHSKLVAEMNSEIEIVRRRLGTSVRKTRVTIPESWRPFWE